MARDIHDTLAQGFTGVIVQMEAAEEALLEEDPEHAVRHVRRDGLDTVKKLEKNHEISEDDQERLANDVQKATDGTIAEIDQLLAAKEKEILTV